MYKILLYQILYSIILYIKVSCWSEVEDISLRVLGNNINMPKQEVKEQIIPRALEVLKHVDPAIRAEAISLLVKKSYLNVPTSTSNQNAETNSNQLLEILQRTILTDKHREPRTRAMEELKKIILQIPLYREAAISVFHKVLHQST